MATQTPDTLSPIIDSIVVITHDIFDASEASGNFLFKLANAVRFRTRPSVVRRELLFEKGSLLDSATVAETLRNLRERGLFRSVSLDTVRHMGRLVVRVETRDGWSTNLEANGRSTGGTFTWSTGITEQNFLGNGDFARVAFRSDVDRKALTAQSIIRRVGGSRVDVSGFYDDLSDGYVGGWGAGSPFRSFSDRRSAIVAGSVARRRILQYRDGLRADSLQRRALHNAAAVGFAPIAGPGGYVRVGIQAQVRREEFLAWVDRSLSVPDTVTGAVGVFAEWARARFKVVKHYNGFDRDEDIDLSARASVAAWVAPSAFGYSRSGIGPVVFAQAGLDFGRGFAKVTARGNGLFNAAGLDSGQVWVGLTVGSQPFRKQATVLHVQAGAMDGIPAGLEFDLGHGVGPRSFSPHAFTGNRMAWGLLEHRAFLVDEVLSLLGLGFAGFLDYGGAWFSDQPARAGGNVGVGLRLGATRSTGTNVGRFDLAYRFGEGRTGKRWVFSFGRSYTF